MKEIWRDIKGYEGLYQVSNLGRVKSLPRFRQSHYKGGYYSKTRIMRGEVTFNGYARVGLTKDNKTRKVRIHRLVAETFIDNPHNLEQVNHIDGNKNNNKVNNLEWVNRSQNMKHAYKNNLIFAPKGNKSSLYGKINGLCKHSKKVICVTTGDVYDSIIEIERKYGINHAGISACCIGKRKSAGKHPVTGEKLVWKYYENSK